MSARRSARLENKAAERDGLMTRAEYQAAIRTAALAALRKLHELSASTDPAVANEARRTLARGRQRIIRRPAPDLEAAAALAELDATGRQSEHELSNKRQD